MISVKTHRQQSGGRGAMVRASMVLECPFAYLNCSFAVPRSTWPDLWRSPFLPFQDALNAKGSPRARSSRGALSSRLITSYAYAHLTKTRQRKVPVGPVFLPLFLSYI